MPKLLDTCVAEHGDDLALVDERGESSWAELSERVVRLMHVLTGAGLAPGDTFAVMVGVPDDEYGEQIKAVVQTVDGVDGSETLADELTALCRDMLAGYKRPKSIDWSDALPRSAAGKLLKRELRQPYWEGTGRTI